MTAFLKIDNCKTCHRALPWEWVPAVLLSGKALAGTSVWRSQLMGGLCPACLADLERRHQKQERTRAMRSELLQLLGGEKPYREFTFERYEVTPGNQLAYERSKHFNPSTENLYLWGPCGVGKTHLAWAVARHCFEETLTVAILRAYQLSRKVRMKEPETEQAVINGFAEVDVLVLDDLGMNDTPYSRQILQEILDARDYADRAGLVVASNYSLGGLADKLQGDIIPSRLAGLCQVVEITGVDRRLIRGGARPAST